MLKDVSHYHPYFYLDELIKTHLQLVGYSCQYYPFKILINTIIVQLVSQCFSITQFEAC